MDITLLQTIIESDYALPEGYTINELTPQLMTNLGATDSYVREQSLETLWVWMKKGYYSAEQFRDIGSHMADNLTKGIGETGTDTVFLRSFSTLILAAVILYDELYEARAIEGRQAFLEEKDVRVWFEQGLTYLQEEKDLRGYVPEKEWAHALGHSADLLGNLARSRYLGVNDLGRLLNAIAAKVTAPGNDVYFYWEDERLANAVISALLRDLLEMPFLQAWLDRLVSPPNQPPWHEVYADASKNNARHNTRAFLRSVYFQVLLGARNNYRDAYYDRSPDVRDELLPCLTKALKDIDHGMFYRKDT